jgi:hypothetical protein
MFSQCADGRKTVLTFQRRAAGQDSHGEDRRIVLFRILCVDKIMLVGIDHQVETIVDLQLAIY